MCEVGAGRGEEEYDGGAEGVRRGREGIVALMMMMKLRDLGSVDVGCGWSTVAMRIGEWIPIR